MSSAGRTKQQLIFRQAQAREMDWVYRIFKSGMQSYITRTWGWNELFQEHSFFANLPASSFVIASIDAGEDFSGSSSGNSSNNRNNQNGTDIGGYCLKKKSGYLSLEMLLVDPAWQRQGYGSAIMTEVMQQANRLNLPVRLSVLKINPAARFYQSLGFVVESEDSIRYRMIRTA